MMKKLSPIIVLFLFWSAIVAGAQQFTTVAVVDAQRVYDSFAKGNSLSAGANAIRLRYQEQIDAQSVAIQRLQEQRNALSATDTARIRDIDARINVARAEINRLDQLSSQELRRQRQFITPSNFIPEMQRAVIFVAESKGYTLIFDADDSGLQWWSPVVDITDAVIERLIVQLAQ